MVTVLKELLVQFDPTIQEVEISYGPERIGDIPHSLASIDKAKKLLNYNPQYSFVAGIKEAVQWYWENLKDK
jgi:UDP-N-acetylglucosamine 4-epimerase